MSPVTRLKHLARLRTDIVDPRPRPLLDLGALESGTGRLASKAELPEVSDPGSGVASVSEGDVLFGKLRPYLAKTWVADRPCFASTELLCLRPASGVGSRWLGYVVRSRPFVEFAAATSDGAKMPRTSWSKLAEFRLAAPDVRSQQHIADYLDRETARIDGLIAAKRRMVKLLRARRQAAIDRTIGKAGSSLRVKHLVIRLTSGPRNWASYEADDGVLFIRITNVSADDIELDMENVMRLSPPMGAERRRTAVRSGDVLLSITAEIGSVGVARESHAGAAVSQHVALLTPSACSGDWLAYALSTSEAKAQQEAACYGGTKTQLGLGDVANISIPLASKGEERRLLSRLSNEIHVIQQLERCLSDQMHLLAEHREALIAAAVLGRRDAPDEQ